MAHLDPVRNRFARPRLPASNSGQLKSGRGASSGRGRCGPCRFSHLRAPEALPRAVLDSNDRACRERTRERGAIAAHCRGLRIGPPRPGPLPVPRLVSRGTSTSRSPAETPGSGNRRDTLLRGETKGGRRSRPSKKGRARRRAPVRHKRYTRNMSASTFTAKTITLTDRRVIATPAHRSTAANLRARLVLLL